MPSRRLPPNARKLLVASVGVASVSYVIACSSTSTSGNLVAPPPADASVDRNPPPTSGNLVAPEPDSGHDAAGDAAWDATSGNLVPPDAGNDDASDDAASE